MSRLIQISEQENIELIKISSRDKPLQLSFGANRVYIDIEKADKEFVKKIAELRGLT